MHRLRTIAPLLEEYPRQGNLCRVNIIFRETRKGVAMSARPNFARQNRQVAGRSSQGTHRRRKRRSILHTHSRVLLLEPLEDRRMLDGHGLFPGEQFSVGNSPSISNIRSVVVADVNRDGVPDVVTTNDELHNVSVLLGRGDGTFHAKNTFAVGSKPRSVAVADVNRDGVPDVVTANAGSNNVSVLLGRGNGTFHAQTKFPTGSNPVSVVVADVNGDEVPDVVTANAGSNNASVLLGRGDGTFHGQNTFAVGSSPYSVAVADVNGDGVPDVVTANYESYNVSVLLGRGDGTFQSQTTFVVWPSYRSNPSSVVVADVNGDGWPDLLAACSSQGSGDRMVSVLLGHGDGTFAGASRVYLYTSPTSMSVADLNGDGVPDLVTAHPSSGVPLGTVGPRRRDLPTAASYHRRA